jgi:hypothetical protein
VVWSSVQTWRWFWGCVLKGKECVLR